jgi:hypothetical protein
MPRRKTIQQGDGLKDLIDKFLPTRKQFPPKVRNAIAKYGDQKITSIVVGRSPVQKYVTKLLNYLSLGKFEEQLKSMDYDDVYHLFSLIGLENGITLLVEKNSVVNVQPVSASYINKAKDKVDIPVSKNVTFGEFMNNAVKAVGESLFLYDHVHNNCQKFITDLLKYSGLGSSSAYNFINQDIEKALSTSPEYTNIIARAATELDAKIDTVSDICFVTPLL